MDKDGKTTRGKILLPSAMMAVVGLLVGTAMGPVPLAGSILGADEGTHQESTGFALDPVTMEASFANLASEASSCPKDFEPKRPWSNQETDCEFLCPPPGGAVTVFVDADDPDAYVSGTGSCGAHDAHCSDRDYCEDTVTYTGSPDGTCSGEADEAWASGFYLNCYANAEDTSKDPPGDWCIVEEPVRVCIDPDARSSSFPYLGVFSILCTKLTCEVDIGDGTLVVRMEDGRPGIHIGGFAGKVIGAVCDDTGACELIRPSAEERDGVSTFTV